MKRTGNFITLIVLFIISACQSDQMADSTSIETLFREYHEFKLRINPIEATKGGTNKYNDKIVNYISDEHKKELINEYSSFLDKIAQANPLTLIEEDRMSLEVMKWDSEIKKQGLENKLVTIASPMYDLPTMALMPLTQTTSLHLYVSQLAGGQSVHPFNTVKDYEDWLSRMDDYMVFLNTAIDNMKVGVERGVVLPTVIINRVIDQLLPFINTPVEEHFFYLPMKHMPSEFSAEDQSKIADAYALTIKEKVIPGYKSLHSFMVNDYLPHGRATSGIGDLPDGKDTYDYLIKLHTSTEMTADEIHELGLTEVKRILSEMEKVKGELGYQGDVKSFFDFVRSSKEQMPFTEPQQVIDNFYSINDRVAANLDNLFRVKSKGGFEVRRTESFREASASAEYVPGTKSGSRPGVFYVPIPDVLNYNKFADEALFLHEAIPGHHYQLSLQQENEHLPEFLHAEGMGVFVEGWALYAESLGKELGLYTDLYQYLGMLSMEMHRAIRLVVDTGIHAKGWSRERAIQFSLDHEAESEDAIIAEIERYMVCPGQALSYKIGQMKIIELRNKAADALSAKFDIKEFHNQVLNSGSLPLVLLEKKIDMWIEKVKKSS